MDVDGGQFILAGQEEGKLPVADQGQPLSVGVMDRIDLIQTFSLVAKFLRELNHVDRANVDDVVIHRVEKRMFRIHSVPFLPT